MCIYMANTRLSPPYVYCRVAPGTLGSPISAVAPVLSQQTRQDFSLGSLKKYGVYSLEFNRYGT